MGDQGRAGAGGQGDGDCVDAGGGSSLLMVVGWGGGRVINRRGRGGRLLSCRCAGVVVASSMEVVGWMVVVVPLVG